MENLAIKNFGHNALRVKICGITNLEQGRAIANLGATALGFILVPSSPRYISPTQLASIIPYLPAPVETILRPNAKAILRPNAKAIGVFADSSLEEISQIVRSTGLNAVQLHGQETPEYCRALRQQLPTVELIKALRIRSAKDLANTINYETVVDTLLLDAYHPQLLGGTGHTLDWSMLQNFTPTCPWFLAGGLNPDNILEALSKLNPDGIDLSSGVELAPGNKDLSKVEKLFQQLKTNKN